MYYQQHLGMDLLKSGIFSVLPWITMAVFANVGGWLADSLIQKGMSVTRVRKIMQTVSCLLLEQLLQIRQPGAALQTCGSCLVRLLHALHLWTLSPLSLVVSAA